MTAFGRAWCSLSSRLKVELGLLLIVCGVAAWVAYRRVAYRDFLRHASIAQLVQEVQKHPNNPQTLLALAKRLTQSGRLNDAFDTYQKLVQIDPNLEEAWTGLAQVAEPTRGAEVAFSILQALLKRRPQSVAGHLALAELYQKHQFHSLAAKEAAIATYLQPQNATAWRLLGVEQFIMQQPEAAERSLRQAVRLAPRNWACLDSLGGLLMETGRTSQALPFFQQAVRVAPEAPLTHYWLGKALLSAKTEGQALKAEALRHLETAYRLQPNDVRICLLLSECLVQQNRLSEARDVLLHAQALDPTNPDPPFQLSIVYQRLGQTEQAHRQAAIHQALLAYLAQKHDLITRFVQTKRPELERALARLCARHADFVDASWYYQDYLRRVPKDGAARNEFAALSQKMLLQTGSVEALLHQADALFTRKQFQNALSFYLAALGKDRNNPFAAQGAGLCLNALNRPDDAFFFLEHATRVNPQLPEAQYALAQMYAEAGFSLEAARRLREALKTEPNNPLYLQALGSVLSQSELTQAEGLELLNRAYALAPTNLSLLLDLAESQTNNDRINEADATYRRALKLAPNNPDVLMRYAGFLVENRPNQLQEADSLLQKLGGNSGSDPYVYYCKGRIALLHGHATQAVLFLRKAIEGNPGVAQAWYYLSRAYALVGKEGLAKQALSRSQQLQHDFLQRVHLEEEIKEHPKDFSLHLELARVNVRQGRNAQAINQYQICLRLEPENRVVAKELYTLEARLKRMGQMPNMGVFNAMVASLAPDNAKN